LALGPLFSSRGVANKAAIAELPRLPESANELRSEARAFGASDADLLLGSDATERSLRARVLGNYKVISFATHGIVAGEIPGVTEPALVLSPMMDEASSKDDGLLTVTKIANLELDANLVILSACNTAASDGRVSGRGLSGLADAFFFAGARAVAVTQWAVYSPSAENLGAGLISQSAESGSVGVAEGLRRAMLNYVAGASEDYQANPRFWAAFIIAGDGAVRPLEGPKDSAGDSAKISLEWERLTPEAGDSEILGAANRPDNGGLYYLGKEKPPPGGKRAGSFVGIISANREPATISRDPLVAASGMVSVGDEIAVLGYLPTDTKSQALFRVLDHAGKVKWEHIEESERWRSPISIYRVAGGYLLVSIGNSFHDLDRSSLILTVVSDAGVSLNERKYEIAIRPMRWGSKTAAMKDGRIIVAIGGNKWALPTDPSPMWVNPTTGTRKMCPSPEATQLFEIDPKSLEVERDKVLDGLAIVSMTMRNEKLVAAGEFVATCHLEKKIEVIELESNLEATTIFKSTNVNSLEVWDISSTKDDHILLGGIVRTFLPTSLKPTIMSMDELRNVKVGDPWSESYWVNSEQRNAAFVLELDKQGFALRDRVFADSINRDITTLVPNAKGDYVAFGGAFGNRGWVAGLRLGKISTGDEQ
jgi:hypothetical protein